jgi:hypothetical protein
MYKNINQTTYSQLKPGNPGVVLARSQLFFHTFELL